MYFRSRQIPLAELQQWLAASSARTLVTLYDVGPNAPAFCAPMPDAMPARALTSVCANVPEPMRGNAGQFSTSLVLGLQGGADSNADLIITGDELATWLRSQGEGRVSVYQSGPVAAVFAVPAPSPEVMSPAGNVPEKLSQPKDKLDAALWAIVEQSANAGAVVEVLKQAGVASYAEGIPVQLTLANMVEPSQVARLVEQLGGKVAAHKAQFIYAFLPPSALKALLDDEAIWSMTLARPSFRPMSY